MTKIQFGLIDLIEFCMCFGSRKLKLKLQSTPSMYCCRQSLFRNSCTQADSWEESGTVKLFPIVVCISNFAFVSHLLGILNVISPKSVLAAHKCNPDQTQILITEPIKKTIRMCHQASANYILGEFPSSSCSCGEPGRPGDRFWLDDRNSMVNLMLHGLCEGGSIIAAVQGWGAVGPQTLLREGAELLC